MELFSAEAKAIQSQVGEWIQHPEYELETTFGQDGRVDQTTFISVAKRLRAKGFTSLPQEDRLTIMTKDHVRFALSGLGIIQQYCRDDLLAGKPFQAMIKDRSTPSSNVDLEEYNVRIKSRREIPMGPDDPTVKKLLEEWPRTQKAFRMIRRWSFESDGVRFDLSIVRSTKKLAKKNGMTNGDFKWQRRFRDQDVMQSQPIYEIEVELLRQEGDTPESAMKRLVKGVGEVLRGIQKYSLLIRNSTKTKVLDSYKQLVGSNRFRGPALRPLMKKNYSKDREDGEPNIRDGFNVTDKADGLRCLAFCDSKGEMFLIDMAFNVYRSGLKNPECRLSLIDGEWVTQTKDKEPINQFLAFDIFYTTDKKDVSQLPFQGTSAEENPTGRHDHLKKWITNWNKDEGPKVVASGVTPKTRLQVSMKDYLFGRAGDTSIFGAAARVLDTARLYYTDGLIFTSNKEPLPAAAGATFMHQFKWKPPKDNTIDFLVKMEKAADSQYKDKLTHGIHPDTGETITYKTLRLFVGSTRENYRGLILNNQPLPSAEQALKGRGEYKPVLFQPAEFPDPMASVCNVMVETDPDTGEMYAKTEDTDEPIQGTTIVEMAYDIKATQGWRWKPIRVRMDKTERLQAGQLARTLNSDTTANDTWNTYYDPITVGMIRSGNEQPTEAEQEELNKVTSEMGIIGKRYFDRSKAQVQDQTLVRGMRDFHNKYIKEQILYRVGLGGGDKKVLDVACGVGSDIHIWRRGRASFVLGVDYSTNNINSAGDNIYKRYAESMIKAGGRESSAQMIFVNGDSSKNYVSGEAGANDEEKNILRAVIGRVPPAGPIPPYADQLSGRLKAGADCISCIFALHYFFETPKAFNGFITNIAENLKVGGYFIGCCFDGEKVFEFLRGVDTGSSKSGIEKDSTLWSITKQYTEDDMPDGEDCIGLPIDVKFITIGETHREYLVSFKFLKEAMKSIGCELMGPEDLKRFKLQESSNTFDKSWDMAKKAGRNFPMIETIKNFSFMNRWFIFQRKSMSGPSAEAAGVAGLAAIKSAAANSVRRTEEDLKSALEETSEGAAKNQKYIAAATAAKAAPLRTVPVAPGQLAAPSEKRTYTAGELFQFYAKAAEKDILGIGDKGAGQWLSPTAPFPIEDPYDGDTIYPSLNHFLAAMRFRVASTTPELAATLFGRDGTIHQKFNRMRLLETDGGKKPLSEKRDKELLEEEAVDVKEAIRPSSFKKYKSTFDEAKWATKKDEILREGLRQRWETDARFRKIVEAAKDKGKTLLYYAPGANSSNLGGVRRNSGEIEGENKMGKILMELAGF